MRQLVMAVVRECASAGVAVTLLWLWLLWLWTRISVSKYRVELMHGIVHSFCKELCTFILILGCLGICRQKSRLYRPILNSTNAITLAADKVFLVRISA
jgi:hypothetical protein